MTRGPDDDWQAERRDFAWRLAEVLDTLDDMGANDMGLIPAKLADRFHAATAMLAAVEDLIREEE